MVITPHALASVIISVNIERLHTRNPRHFKRWLAIGASCFLSFCSHFLLDAVPHYEYSIQGPDNLDNALKIAFDLATALVVIGFVFKNQTKELLEWSRYPIQFLGSFPKAKFRNLPFLVTMFASVAASIIPDVLTQISRTTGTLFAYKAFHDFYHTRLGVDSIGGIPTQIAIVILLFYLCSRYAGKLDKEKTDAKMNSMIKEIDDEMPIYFREEKK